MSVVLGFVGGISAVLALLYLSSRIPGGYVGCPRCGCQHSYSTRGDKWSTWCAVRFRLCSWCHSMSSAKARRQLESGNAARSRIAAKHRTCALIAEATALLEELPPEAILSRTSLEVQVAQLTAELHDLMGPVVAPLVRLPQDQT